MLQGQWEVELLRVLRQTKATMACQAQEGQPTLYPFLCLLSEGEFVSMLLQVGQGWVPGRRTGVQGWGARAEDRQLCSGNHSFNSCCTQVVRVLPSQGEPLLHLAHDLGLRVLNRHLVKQKQVTNHVEKLEQRYSQYLRLLASNTQVKGADFLLITPSPLSSAPSPTTSVSEHGQPWALLISSSCRWRHPSFLGSTGSCWAHRRPRHSSPGPCQCCCSWESSWPSCWCRPCRCHAAWLPSRARAASSRCSTTCTPSEATAR